MNSLMELHQYVRAALLAGLLVLQLLEFCAMILEIVRQNKRKYIPVLALFFLINGTMLILLAAANKSIFLQVTIKPYLRRLLAMPSFGLYLFLIISFLYLIRIFRQERHYRRNSVSGHSVKESMDTLNAGLCFSAGNGRILLANHQMEALCHRITGCDLQDGEEFWRVLTAGTISGPVKKLTGGDHPTLLFPDGSVWSFVRRPMEAGGETVQQLYASDITELYDMTLRLQEENRQVADMNERLRQYDKNIAEMTRMKEQLAAKVRIHDEFGQALLAAHYCLAAEAVSGADVQRVLEAWKRNIAVLQQKTRPQEKKHLMKHLTDAAESVGIQVVLEGSVPEGENSEAILAAAAAEALTNAAIHAKAGILNIQLGQTEDEWTAVFSNNGIPPQGEITEGGGLGSLRKRLEKLGGRMEVCTEPAFSLRIAVPKKVEVNSFV